MEKTPMNTTKHQPKGSRFKIQSSQASAFSSLANSSASFDKSAESTNASPHVESSTESSTKATPRPKGSTSFVFRSHRQPETPTSTQIISLESICALSEYSDMSSEEIRVEDYKDTNRLATSLLPSGQRRHTADEIPLALRHPTFGEFMDDLDADPRSPSSKAVALFVHDFHARISGALPSGDSPFHTKSIPSVVRELAQKHLELTIDMNGRILYQQHQLLSFHYSEDLSLKSLVSKLKSEPPHHETSRICLHLVFEDSWMLVAGSISIDSQNISCQPLTQPIFLRSNTHDTSSRTQLLRAFSAITATIQRFKATYEQGLFLKPQPFPYPNAFRCSGSNKTTNMETISQFSPHRLRFRARVPSSTSKSEFPVLEDPSTLSILFVRRYSLELHALCASAGYAPNLIAYEPLPGGWFMVVTERPPVYAMRFDPVHHAGGLRDVVRMCHEKGYVLGSLRQEDILFQAGRSGEFMLLKLECGGVEGEVLHGFDLDEASLRIEGVVPGGFVTKKDDLAMLDSLLRSG